MNRGWRAWLFVIVLAGAAGEAEAAPCGVFTDVQDTDNFCNQVLWLRNANVTLGCGTGTTYCPFNNVTRAQMALFMQRLSRATTPGIGFVESSTPPTGDLDTTGHQLCQTPGVHGAKTVANDRYWHGEGNGFHPDQWDSRHVRAAHVEHQRRLLPDRAR